MQPGRAVTSPIHRRLAGADGHRLAALHWRAPRGAPGVVVVHGHGSRKENHADVAALLAARGLAVLALDLRGHGESGGELDGGSLGDVAAALAALADAGHDRLGLRGSSLGGLLALAASADDPRVGAVVAICSARPEGLATHIGADWPLAVDLRAAVRRAGVARGFWHATGDELVPWAHSFALAGASPPPVRLRVRLGGSHTSLQHAPDVLAETTDFLVEHLAG